MLEFEDSARSEAPPQAVWKILYDPPSDSPNGGKVGDDIGRRGRVHAPTGWRS
jgi:hypothetical protein